MQLTFDQIRSLVNSIYPKIFTQNEIPVEIFYSQAITESSGNTQAFANDRNGGSYGLFQVNKNVLRTINVDPNLDLFDPKINTTVSLTYTKKLYYGELGNQNILNIQKPSLRTAMTLLCYNCGPGNFNLLYKNHLANKNLKVLTWSQAILNRNLLNNWKSCLNYPIKVFFNAKTYFKFENFND